MTSRRADSAPRMIAALARDLADLKNRASRKGHGHALGYAEVTANQGGIGAENDLTGLEATVNVPAGRRIKITGHAELGANGVDHRLIFRIRDEGDNELQGAAQYTNVASTSAGERTTVQAVVSPSAGQHTYRLTLQRTVGSGASFLTASSTRPAFILVEDIGAAP